MNINTRLRSVQKSLKARAMALFWLKSSQECGGYFEYWNNAEFQAWPSETEEGGLLYYLALEVNNSVIAASDVWRQIASWAALLGISIIESMGASKTDHNIPERFREKLCRLLADVHAHEEAVDLISQGYFEGNEVLFADAREYLKASRESAEELMACFNWFAAETGKEPIVTGSGDARTAGRVEQLLNDWVRLSRGKALAANGKVFEGRDQILSLLSK